MPERFKVNQVYVPLESSYRMQGFYRFILALMVLWSHSVVSFFPEMSGWFSDLQLGNVGVSSFFVLSGYLMSEAISNWYSNRLPNFLINRYLHWPAIVCGSRCFNWCPPYSSASRRHR